MLIVPKGNSGFLYQIKIDGLAIEQNMVGPMAELPMDIGTRSIQLPKTPEGLGMTLRNNPHRTGVVVWTVEEGRAAATAGLRVGDVVLSVEDHAPVMVIDTACQSNIMGKKWRQDHSDHLTGLGLSMKHSPYVKTFRFGNAPPSPESQELALQSRLACRDAASSLWFAKPSSPFHSSARACRPMPSA